MADIANTMLKSGQARLNTGYFSFFALILYDGAVSWFTFELRGTYMNSDTLKGQWTQVKGAIRK